MTCLHDAPRNAVRPARKFGSSNASLLVFIAIVALLVAADVVRTVIQPHYTMHLAVAVPDRGIFSYSLMPPLTGPLQAGEKQQALFAALPDAGTADLPLSKDPEQLSLYVCENAVPVTTYPTSRKQVGAQLAVLNKAMDKVFGKGQYRAPLADQLWTPADAKLQREVGAILQRRLELSGCRARVFPAKPNLVKLDIAGKKTLAQVKQLLGVTARLEFRLLPPEITVGLAHDTGKVSISRHGTPITDQQAIAASYLALPNGAFTPNCGVTYDTARQPAVSFSLASAEDRKQFAAVTGANIGRQLAIVLDGKIIAAPTIVDAIPGDGIISGGIGTPQNAQDLANLLNAGALPVPVKFVSRDR